MSPILGIDVSLTSLGWFYNDGKKKPVYGSFKTKKEDGILLKRIMTQRDRFVNLLNDFKVDHIGIERPLMHTYSTELLFALHQFIFEVCYTRHIKVVYITPAQIKQYVVDNHVADKNEIIIKTRQTLGLLTEKMNDDESDAYWVSVLSKKFWELYYKEINAEDLTEKEKYIFLKTKSKTPGILYKENDSFFIF